jgi:hypothetical protein
MLITPVNFLRWYDTQIDPRLPDLPYPWQVDGDGCTHTVIAVPAEAAAFYINTKLGLSYADFDDLKVGMFRKSNEDVISPALGPLYQQFIGDTANYNIWASIVWPPALEDTYYLKIYRGGSGEVLLTSSTFILRTDLPEIYKVSAYVRFRHDRNHFNVNYPPLPAFFQQFRLYMGVIDEPLDIDDAVYIDGEGKPRTTRAAYSKMTRVKTIQFTARDHLAAGIMFKSTFLEINNRTFLSKGNYKYVPDAGSATSNGEVELYDLEITALDRC